MAKKDEIKTTFDQLTVTAKEELPPGSGVFNSGWLQGKKCRVLATYIHRFRDNSSVPAFLVQDTDGTIREIVCCRCIVV